MWFVQMCSKNIIVIILNIYCNSPATSDFIKAVLRYYANVQQNVMHNNTAKNMPNGLDDIDKVATLAKIQNYYSDNFVVIYIFNIQHHLHDGAA